MKVIFVRHAAAVDKTAFKRADMLRPLTDQGMKVARQAAVVLEKVFPEISLVISSEAVRARQTANILAKAFKGIKVRESGLLNPGSGLDEIRELLAGVCEKHETVAVVGHEPDFSHILAHSTGEGKLNIAVEKAACIAVDMNCRGKGQLILLLPPWAVAALQH